MCPKLEESKRSRFSKTNPHSYFLFMTVLNESTFWFQKNYSEALLFQPNNQLFCMCEKCNCNEVVYFTCL